MNLISLLLVIIGGIGLGTEAGLLGPLGKLVGPYWAALSIFSSGAAILFFIMLLFAKRSPIPLSSIPGWYMAGGILGALNVIIMTVSAPVIGVAMTMTGILAGQIANSIIIDHYGLLGMTKRPVDARRLAALTLIVAALYLISGGNE